VEQRRLTYNTTQSGSLCARECHPRQTSSVRRGDLALRPAEHGTSSTRPSIPRLTDTSQSRDCKVLFSDNHGTSSVSCIYLALALPPTRTAIPNSLTLKWYPVMGRLSGSSAGCVWFFIFFPFPQPPHPSASVRLCQFLFAPPGTPSPRFCGVQGEPQRCRARERGREAQMKYKAKQIPVWQREDAVPG